MAQQGLSPAETNLSAEGGQKAQKVYSQLRLIRPVTRKMLRDYVKVFIGIDVPDKKICPPSAVSYKPARLFVAQFQFGFCKSIAGQCGCGRLGESGRRQNAYCGGCDAAGLHF